MLIFFICFIWMCSVSHSGDLEHANEAYPRNKNYSNKGNIDLKRGFSQTQVQGRFYSRYHTLWDFANNFSIFPGFLRPNWRVIFEVFQSNFDFRWLNSTVRCLVWENEQKNWEIFTSSLCSYISKSGNFSRIFSYCAMLLIVNHKRTAEIDA